MSKIKKVLFLGMAIIALGIVNIISKHLKLEKDSQPASIFLVNTAEADVPDVVDYWAIACSDCAGACTCGGSTAGSSTACSC